MAEWVDVADAEKIPPGAFAVVAVEDAPIAVFNLDGEFYAIDDLCSHDGGTLTGGQVEGEEIICPRHGARFNIKTGAVTAPPAYEPVHIFPIRIRNGRVQLQDDRWD
jgi:3-phenylpropionate/trans-cinnamate dioxygenase ferredoxin subunit